MRRNHESCDRHPPHCNPSSQGIFLRNERSLYVNLKTFKVSLLRTTLLLAFPAHCLNQLSAVAVQCFFRLLLRDFVGRYRPWGILDHRDDEAPS
jgi:hypothetical protein